MLIRMSVRSHVCVRPSVAFLVLHTILVSFVYLTVFISLFIYFSFSLLLSFFPSFFFLFSFFHFFLFSFFLCFFLSFFLSFFYLYHFCFRSNRRHCGSLDRRTQLRPPKPPHSHFWRLCYFRYRVYIKYCVFSKNFHLSLTSTPAVIGCTKITSQ